jgi:hypothetical protein
MPFTGRASAPLRASAPVPPDPVQRRVQLHVAPPTQKKKGCNRRPEVRSWRDVRSSVPVLRAARQERTIPVKTVDGGYPDYNVL